jgi:hypothetical protein
MHPLEPALHADAHRVVFAKDQPPYIPLPASVDAHGTVMTEWELTAEELDRVLSGGRIRLWLLYTSVKDGKPFTPVSLEVLEPIGGRRGTG